MKKAISLGEIVEEYGFPLYLYEEDIILRQISILKEGLPCFDTFFSIKANPNINICRCMSREGIGADAASAGEVVKAGEAGFASKDILYSSPGKTAKDIPLCYPKPAGHPADSAPEPDVIVSHHPAPQKSGLEGTCLATIPME